MPSKRKRAAGAKPRAPSQVKKAKTSVPKSKVQASIIKDAPSDPQAIKSAPEISMVTAPKSNTHFTRSKAQAATLKTATSVPKAKTSAPKAENSASNSAPNSEALVNVIKAEKSNMAAIASIPTKSKVSVPKKLKNPAPKSKTKAHTEKAETSAPKAKASAPKSKAQAPAAKAKEKASISASKSKPSAPAQNAKVQARASAPRKIPMQITRRPVSNRANHIDEAEADDEREDGSDDEESVDEDCFQYNSHRSDEESLGEAEFGTENSDTSDRTDSDEYDEDSEEEIDYDESVREDRELRDKKLPPITYPAQLILALRRQKVGKKYLPDPRLEQAPGRLPNMVRRDGTTVQFPIEIWYKILRRLDFVSAVSMSLINVLNFEMFNGVWGTRRQRVYPQRIDLLKYRSVEPWETGILERPFPFAPAINMKICVRDVIHTWFPKKLTWVPYDDMSKYHGPKSLKIFKKFVRKVEAREARRLRKEKKLRHEARAEAKERRQAIRMDRITFRRERRESRYQEIASNHREDSEFSDDHDCIESGCVKNYVNAYNTTEYMSSGRGTDTDSDIEEANPDDHDGELTSDSVYG